tara:strand:+ start:150 stop:320 length:171 start_codon:yes stop_codon:yes gene_type:complete
MKYTYTAILKSGHAVRAEKINDQWFIGGDTDTTIVSYILRSDGNQYELIGCYLKRT